MSTPHTTDEYREWKRAYNKAYRNRHRAPVEPEDLTNQKPASKYVDPFLFSTHREPWTELESDRAFEFFLELVSPLDMSRVEQWMFMQAKAGLLGQPLNQTRTKGVG